VTGTPDVNRGPPDDGTAAPDHYGVDWQTPHSGSSAELQGPSWQTTEQWGKAFVSARLDDLVEDFADIDEEPKLSDFLKFLRKLEFMRRYVAACDAYPGKWLDVVRYIAIVENLLPPRNVENSIRDGRQQAQIARQWRAAGHMPCKIIPFKYRLPKSTVMALEWVIRQRNPDLLRRFLRDRSEAERLAIVEHIGEMKLRERSA
jgi:hypothetical protein